MPDKHAATADSEGLAIKVDVEIMSRVGWQLTEAEAIDQFVGLSMAQIRDKVEGHIGQGLPASWEDDFNRTLLKRFEAGFRSGRLRSGRR